MWEWEWVVYPTPPTSNSQDTSKISKNSTQFDSIYLEIASDSIGKGTVPHDVPPPTQTLEIPVPSPDYYLCF